MKNILRSIIFLIVGFMILQLLTHIFVPKWMSQVDPASPRFSGFYSLEKNTIDVLVVGASDVGRGYSPLKVWKEYGITSYNLGTSNQTMSLAYYVIKEAIKTQKPKTLVLDMDALFVTKDAPEGEYRKLFDNLKLDDVKLEAINDEDVRAGNQLSYIFPILRFHSRWDKLEKKDVNMSLKKEYKKVSYMGMAMSYKIKPYIDTKKYMEDKGENEKITEENLYYVDKIVNLCHENNIELLWIEIPSTTSWSYARNKATQELANKYNIEFIDYNLPHLIEEIKLDWSKDTADLGNHLNVYGAEKVSKDIGKILSEKYNCTSHKNDEHISKTWNEELERYNKNKEKLEKEGGKKK